jgi:alpha-D-ribose 1-methylphosphonate 5-triphosphate synthase subunit PhnL
VVVVVQVGLDRALSACLLQLLTQSLLETVAWEALALRAVAAMGVILSLIQLFLRVEALEIVLYPMLAAMAALEEAAQLALAEAQETLLPFLRRKVTTADLGFQQET